MFAFRDTADLGPGSPRVEVAFTDGSLDLQWGPDKEAGFEAALAAVEAASGVTFARLHQVHGADVVEVAEAWPAGPLDGVPMADALVTARAGVGLMIRVADCVPVVLADPATGVIGAAHAGRKGVEADVVTRTVERMRSLGAGTGDGAITAWIGPHVCGRCYEVPEAMRAEVAALVPAAHAETSWGTPALDLGAAVAAQLAAAGVTVVETGRCTLEDGSLHSYRRDAASSGRLAGLVWIP
ncbi:polyphenol oxidase family protein [Nocardioides nematodiphilus]|uniref:polyphenol oxidase family protein n=1 Tax=Nocardioides nematodiphilus TaxID=2849669 RepID=UPI001CD9C189|nr:polyphenol oxidase family protein [Nocardioides nematodiphilus]MCA1982495.1 polyphenol oxidase family protein [Nocardioides nematodiphilus]